MVRRLHARSGLFAGYTATLRWDFITLWTDRQAGAAEVREPVDQG
jgi:hypothetical protein